MTRNEARDKILNNVLDIPNNNILLEFATGVGKSRTAIEKVRSISRPCDRILIVVPRNVHKENWKKEFDIWWKDCDREIIYTTYRSFPKYAGKYTAIIYDECHHLSDRCKEAVYNFDTQYSILLSATVNKSLKQDMKWVFKDLYIYNIDIRTAIDNGILPNPSVYLYPLNLDNKKATEAIIKNSKAKGRMIFCDWNNRWKYIRQKNNPVTIKCTEEQFYSDLCSQIEYWKRRYKTTSSTLAHRKWFRLCLDRLKWLSDKKIPYTKALLKHFKDKRTLTFCSSIEQTKVLGENYINSKNKDSLKVKDAFDRGEIDHITACDMLNESMNLVNCQIGIFNNLNSSETICVQRIGRLLRCDNPIIAIPYFKNTREEELVKELCENFNSDLIKVII